MSLTPRLPLQGDQGYLGDPILVGGPALAPTPARSHLVPPPPLGVDVKGDLQRLSTRIDELARRVAILESPGWWHRRWLQLQIVWRVFLLNHPR